MKLGVFINQDFYFDGQKYRTTMSFVKFIESFSEYFNEIVVFAPSQKSAANEKAVYECSDAISVCSLPYYEDIKDLVTRLPSVVKGTSRKMEPEIGDCDVIWIVGPHPLALLTYNMAKKAKVPTFLHYRSNIIEDVIVRFKGIKYLLAKAYAYVLHYYNVLLCKKMPIMVVGSELYDLYVKHSKEIYRISPSIISGRDIDDSIAFLRTKTDMEGRDVELLFVGRVEPEKGIEYLFRALQNLNKGAHRKYKLTLIGGTNRGREKVGIEDNYRRLAKELGIEDLINWVGYVPFGKELLDLYRKADVFVLPSLAEGIPKVLYETMATGVPIITTPVGGIQDVIKNEINGLLIPPGSTESIVAAIHRLVKDNELRKSLINNGLEIARDHTMEKARDLMMEKLVYPSLTNN